MPTVGRWIIPCLETPNGEVVQDGADIIDHFERGEGRHCGASATPTADAVGDQPSLRTVRWGGPPPSGDALSVELDEENLAFLSSEFALLVPGAVLDHDAFLHNSGRMRKAAVNFGVTPDSFDAIESAFEEWLDLLCSLGRSPVPAHDHPTLGDYGLIAAMWAHLGRLIQRPRC